MYGASNEDTPLLSARPDVPVGELTVCLRSSQLMTSKT